MKYALDKLKKVELRDVWPDEALDFTKWLSEEPNLAILSSAVGIELELIETDSSVGSLNVDIYAQEAGTGRRVIIGTSSRTPTTTTWARRLPTPPARAPRSSCGWWHARATSTARPSSGSASTPTATSASSW